MGASWNQVCTKKGILKMLQLAELATHDVAPQQGFPALLPAQSAQLWGCR